MSWDHLSKTLLGWSGGQARDHSGGFKRALCIKTPDFHPHTLRYFHISPTALPLQALLQPQPQLLHLSLAGERLGRDQQWLLPWELWGAACTTDITSFLFLFKPSTFQSLVFADVSTFFKKITVHNRFILSE